MGKHTKAYAAAALLAVLVTASLGAYFLIAEPTVTVSGDEAENGEVRGYGEYNRFVRVRLEAVPDPGYRFAGWFEGSRLVSSDAEYTFFAFRDVKVDAVFEIIKYEVKAEAIGGSASFEGTESYAPGEEVTLKAIPAYGYDFVKWSYGGTESTEDTIMFIMPAHDVEAVCTLKGWPCDITVNKGPNVLSVAGAGIYSYGSEITLKATAEDGYFISEWKSGFSGIGYNASSLKYTVKGDAEISVYAEKYTGASFTIEQKGYGGPYPFLCTDEYSQYSRDSWSARGYDIDNVSYALLCTYEETSEGNWDIRIGYPADLPERKIVRAEITHRAEFAEGVSFEDSVTLDTYPWEYRLTKDGKVLDLKSVIFLKMSAAKYGTEKEYADAWNFAYRDSSDWDDMVIDDSTVRIIANIMNGITVGCTDREKVQCALNFVNNSILYRLDSEVYGNEFGGEYFATPYMTLYNHTGDCEDTSVLFAVLAEQMGYDAYLVSFPDHMTAAVKIGDTGGNFDGYPGIYICETTSDEAAWEVGKVPEELEGKAGSLVNVSI